MTQQIVLVGDCRATLAQLPAQSVHCVVTSPPYLGLRDYGVEGQIGLEQSVAEHIAVMVEVFREVRRVLRDDGTLWLNYGDAYASSVNGRSAADTKAAGGDDRTFRDKPLDTVKASGLKPKDLMMLPARLALALQDDGWYLRSDIIWAKPNPMPESAEDRPTSAHEHLFLFAKSERYFYDADAIRTAAKSSSPLKTPEGWATSGAHSAVADSPNAQRRNERQTDKQRGHSRRHAGFNDRWDGMSRDEQQAKGANARNVWTIATEPFAGEFCTGCRGYFEGKGKKRIRAEKIKADDGSVTTRRHCPCGRLDAWLSHFATFPRELARRAILAGAPTRVCSTCCAPYVRQSEKTFEPQADVSPAKRRRSAAAMDASRRDGGTERGSTTRKTLGFAPSCECVNPQPAPAVVLDPFGGAGTTAIVAYETGRDATLCELNADYAAMARERIERARARGVPGSLEEWADVARVPKTPPAAVHVKPRAEQITLDELIQDHNAAIAATLDAGDLLAIVADVPPPPKARRKRNATPEQAKKKRPSIKTRARLAPPQKPPRKAIRPSKPETPTARVKRERSTKPKGQGR